MTKTLNICKCNSAQWHSPNCRLYRLNQANEFGHGNEIRHKSGATGVVVSASGDVVVARYYNEETGDLQVTEYDIPVWDLTNNFSME